MSKIFVFPPEISMNVDLPIVLIFTQYTTSFSYCICDKKYYYYTLVWSDQIPKFLSKRMTDTKSSLQFGQIWDKVPKGGSPNYEHTKTYQKKSKFRGKYGVSTYKEGVSRLVLNAIQIGNRCAIKREILWNVIQIQFICDTNTRKYARKRESRWKTCPICSFASLNILK